MTTSTEPNPATGYISAPFWWLVCAEPGCGVKSTEGSDYAAWADPGQARDDAIDSEWVESEDGLLFCSEHADRVCGECEKHVSGGVKADQDRMCDECWAEDAEQNHGQVTPTA